MVRLVGGEIAFRFDLFEVVYELRGRHTCELTELPVEMAVVGIAMFIQQGVESVLLRLDQLFGHGLKTLDAPELLGGKTDMLNEYPAELPFA